MKIFIAALATETNTFSNIPTGNESFYGAASYRRFDASLDKLAPEALSQQVWRSCAEKDNNEIIESISAYAEPGGLIVRSVYEGLLTTLMDDLKKFGPVDVVLLSLHGAMMADGYDDCEGDILAHVRDVVGPTVIIGVQLDLHCHLTKQMIDNSNVIIGLKEYPHTDVAARAGELYSACIKAALGETKPVMGMYDCRMIGVWRTPIEPMRSFVRRLKQAECEPGIISVTLVHGFPWADVADVGARVLVVSDGDSEKANALSRTLSREFWDLRNETMAHHHTVEQAIDHAMTAKHGPIVLADVADNAGSGGPSDSTFLLQHIIAMAVGDVAIGVYWDPQAVGFCEAAGEGAILNLRIGGKCGPASGYPVDLPVTVKKLLPQYFQTDLNGDKASFGRGAWVQAEHGVDILLSTVRTQTFSPDAFEAFDIDIAKKRVVVVKSAQHFFAGFSPKAAEILYVTSPGAVEPDFARIPYTKLKTPFWPRCAEPYEEKLNELS